jgi:hypothetical protein
MASAEKMSPKLSARERIRSKLKGGGFDSGGGLGSDAFLKLDDGVNFVRIFPRKNKAGKVDPENDIFYVERRRHFGAGPNNRTIICPKTKSDKADCPVCERVETLRNDGDKKEAGQLAARHRYLMNAVKLDKNGKLPKKPLILDVGKTIIKAICEYYDDTEEYGDPWGSHLGKKGVSYDFKITRTGKGMKTDYAVQSTQRFKDVANPSSLIENLFDLNELFPIPTTEEAEKLFTGDEDDDDEKSSKKSRKSKRAPDPDEEGDDEEGDDEEGDDEEGDDEEGDDEEDSDDADDSDEDDDDKDTDDDDDTKDSDDDKSEDEDDDDKDTDDDDDTKDSDDDKSEDEDDDDKDTDDDDEDSDDDDSADEDSADEDEDEDEDDDEGGTKHKRKMKGSKKASTKVAKKSSPKKSSSTKGAKKGFDRAALAAKMKSALKKGKK